MARKGREVLHETVIKRASNFGNGCQENQHSASSKQSGQINLHKRALGTSTCVPCSELLCARSGNLVFSLTLQRDT